MIVAENDNVDISVDDESSSKELYPHYNTVVVGRNDSIISNTGKISNVVPFTPDYVELQKLDIVNATILYMCQYTDKPYILTVKNSFSVT